MDLKGRRFALHIRPLLVPLYYVVCTLHSVMRVVLLDKGRVCDFRRPGLRKQVGLAHYHLSLGSLIGTLLSVQEVCHCQQQRILRALSHTHSLSVATSKATSGGGTRNGKEKVSRPAKEKSEVGVYLEREPALIIEIFDHYPKWWVISRHKTRLERLTTITLD